MDETKTQPGSDLSVQDWGLIPYKDALKRQMDLVDLVQRELARETVVFCSHPPVVTLGRGTLEGDLCGWQGAVVEVNRGGRATFHGPGQIVAYPIVDLNAHSRKRDLHRYLRTLEEAIILTLKDFGIEASGRSLQVQEEGTDPVEATGVWIGPRKVASMGIGVRKWVTFHGLALNVAHDPNAFHGMKPCGFSPGTMISMEEALGTKVDREQVKEALKRHLIQLL